MIKKIFLSGTAGGLFIALFSLLAACKDKTLDFIITDDIIMLTNPASGVERFACADFSISRNVQLEPADSVSVAWSEGKTLANDSLKIIRLELLRDSGSLVKFTMTLRPLSGQASQIQCMKDFGCGLSPWENFPWKSASGNFLDHTLHQFRVIPRGVSRFTIENYHPTQRLSVRVNPPI